MINFLNFYSLLYISDKDSNPNLKSKNKFEKFKIYLENAMFLNNSLTEKNLNFILITNNIKFLKKNYDTKDLKIKEIKFRKTVKKNITFYSSHFKIDLYKYLSNLKTYSCCLDVDCVAINKPKKIFFKNIKKKKLILYNMTKNIIDSYGFEKVSRSLEILTNKKILKPKWFGGEFVAGPPNFFKLLHDQVLQIEKNYYKNINSFFHLGDEMLMNGALNLLILNYKLERYEDASKFNFVKRFWSSNESKKVNIKKYMNNFLLHLPGDKKYISYCYKANYSIKTFKQMIARRNSSYQFLLVNFLKRFIKVFF